MGRAALDMTVKELAERAGVSTATITRFENHETVNQADVLPRIRRVLEARGVEFLDHNSPGVRLREI